MTKVSITNPETNEVWNYTIEKKLLHFLDKKVKPSLTENDKDYVTSIDGYEGSGKSTFAIQMARYVDPSLSLDRICMTADDFKQAIMNAKHGQAVIYDEAVTGLTSSDSISRIGKLLKSMMMQMRQKNLFVIIILPTIFELNKYAILARSRSFFHVYESKGRRGFYLGFNRKDSRRLYFEGKKTYSYKVRSRFMGRFMKKLPLDELGYRKKKEEALFKADEDKKIKQSKRDLLLKVVLDKYKKLTGESVRDLAVSFTTEEFKPAKDIIHRAMANPVSCRTP